MSGAPLAGIKVLELASYVSAPYTGQMLVDLGAEVVKIEQPPTGDPFRRFSRPAGPYSAVFANCNRGKRSVLADLKDHAQRDAILGLVDTSDVWITNWRPGVANRLGLSDENLVSRNPRLIRLYLSGYGTDGPRANSPVFDTIIQATTGLTHALARTGAPALLPGFSLDKVTAAMATQAVVAALFARERSDRGERIDLSMLAAASYFNFVELFANRTFVDTQPADPRNLPAIGLHPLKAADGWVTLSPVSGTAIKRLCVVLGHPEWAEELQAMTDQTQVSTALFARLQVVLPNYAVDELLAIMSASDVPAARCLSMDEHIDDDQTRAERIYHVDHWEGIGRVRTVRYPATFASAGVGHNPSPPPTPGQDNETYIARSALPNEVSRPD